jgi:hypothetical protein
MSQPITPTICQGALLAAAIAGDAPYSPHSGAAAVAAKPSAAPVSQSAKPDAVPAAMTIADVVKATRVSIGRLVSRTPIAHRDGGTGQASGTGTAFLIDQSGDMVSNCHVASARTGRRFVTIVPIIVVILATPAVVGQTRISRASQSFPHHQGAGPTVHSLWTSLKLIGCLFFCSETERQTQLGSRIHRFLDPRRSEHGSFAKDRIGP